jgi:tRNA(fMet)-specific endonuclease VapC
MNGRYLLDTNVVIAIFANEAALSHQLAGAGEVFVMSVVLRGAWLAQKVRMPLTL